jgi:hypothetical protein
MIWGSFPGASKRFYFLPQRVQTGFRARPASDLVGTAILPGVKVAGGVMLTTPLRPMPRLRISGAISLLPHMPLWRGQGQLYLLLYFVCGAAITHVLLSNVQSVNFVLCCILWNYFIAFI